VSMSVAMSIVVVIGDPSCVAGRSCV